MTGRLDPDLQAAQRKGPKPRPAADRFFEKVRFVDKWYDDGITRTRCLEWTGYLIRGYGQFSVGQLNGRTVQARVHRWLYERWVGPIPKALTIDHLCRNKRCVNPKHLEAVTRAENVLRGEAPSAQNARKTHCKNGHEFTPENTIWRADGRSCRSCKRVYERAYYYLRPPRRSR
jgi:HNH endonuclease